MLATLTTKWRPRLKIKVRLTTIDPTAFRAAASRQDTPALDPEQLEAYRIYREDVGIPMTVLERHPDAMIAVRAALREAVERQNAKAQF